MNVLDLFSGIGGFSLGLERAGMKTVAFCEIEEYPRKVLAKHWPDVPIYNDVRELTGERLRTDGITGIDVICGGFPCQDISVAGNQKGIGEGTRSGLWSECARLLGDIRPQYAIFENVTALLSGNGGRWFEQVLWDISQVGYDAEWHCIPASELGAHHHRDRVWIIAYPADNRPSDKCRAGIIKEQEITTTGRSCSNAPDTDKSGLERRILGSESGKEVPVVIAGCGEDVANTHRQRQQGPGEYVEPVLAAAIKNWQAINAESGCISGVWAAEPDVGRTLDGISRQLDEIGGLSDEAKTIGAETLQAMRGTVWQEAYEWAAGGLRSVSEAQVLLSILCEYQRRKDAGRLEVEGEADARGIMRNLWGNIEASRPSLQSRCDRQLAREYSDALCQLSHNTPSLITQAWQQNIWDDGIAKVANGVPARAHRLKALGNAVVPQIPELIGRTIMEATHAIRK